MFSNKNKYIKINSTVCAMNFVQFILYNIIFKRSLILEVIQNFVNAYCEKINNLTYLKKKKKYKYLPKIVYFEN